MVTEIENAINKLEEALAAVETDLDKAKTLVIEATGHLASAVGMKLTAGPDVIDTPNQRSGNGG